MPQAAQPVNGQSMAVGLSIRKVIVEQVVPERGVAIVRDALQYTTEIPYRVQQGQARMPRVGDYWYVDRSMGPWVFSSYIAKDDTDLATMESLTVTGDTVLKGGLTAAEILSEGNVTVIASIAALGNLSTFSDVVAVGKIYADGNKFVKRTTDSSSVTAGNSTNVLTVSVDCLSGRNYEVHSHWHGIALSAPVAFPGNRCAVVLETSTGVIIGSRRIVAQNTGNAQEGGTLSGIFTATATGPLNFIFRFSNEAGGATVVNATSAAPAGLFVRGF
jgi:hypothetical protein